MTKDELTQWLNVNANNTRIHSHPIIVGQYKLVEIEGVWKVDVKGDVNFFGMRLTELPISFHKVSGMFNCSHNMLPDFKKSPVSADRVDYGYNMLTGLEGCPKTKHLHCKSNEITSLEHCHPDLETLYCNYNSIKSLEGCPLNLEIFKSDFSHDEYERYIQSEKDRLEDENSSIRVSYIESIMNR